MSAPEDREHAPVETGATPDEDARQKAGLRPWGFWATAGLAAVIAVVFVGAQIAVGIVFAVAATTSGHQDVLSDPQKLQTNGLFLALATCGAAPVAVGLTWLFAWLRSGIQARDYLGLRRVSARHLIRWCIALLALGAISDGLSALLGRSIVPDVIVESYRTAWSPPLLWFAVIVLAPINEEIFFRGFVFAGFSRSPIGARATVLLTALLWSVIHFQYDWYGVAVIFASGLLLGYARLKTNSVYPCILMHALMNLIATIQVAALIRFVGPSG